MRADGWHDVVPVAPRRARTAARPAWRRRCAYRCLQAPCQIRLQPRFLHLARCLVASFCLAGKAAVTLAAGSDAGRLHAALRLWWGTPGQPSSLWRRTRQTLGYKSVLGAPLQVRRYKLEEWLGEPFFGRALVGALVRVAIKRAYILAEVLQAVEREPGTYRRALSAASLSGR